LFWVAISWKTSRQIVNFYWANRGKQGKN